MRPRELPPIGDDLILMVRAAIGGAGVVAALMFIRWVLPILSAWWQA